MLAIRPSIAFVFIIVNFPQGRNNLFFSAHSENMHEQQEVLWLLLALSESCTVTAVPGPKQARKDADAEAQVCRAPPALFCS